jgi:hypothetical protein
MVRGSRQDEDYDVIADGKVVGRILEEGSRFGPPELLWGWSITVIVPLVSARISEARGPPRVLVDEASMWYEA